MTDVVNREFTATLSGGESMRQRLADALRFPLGSLPGARDYGSRIYDALDKNTSAAGAAIVFRAVAEAIARPQNGLQDLRLQNIRIADWQDNTLRVIVNARHNDAPLAAEIVLQ